MLGSVRPRSTAGNSWDPDDVPWLIGGLGAVVVVLLGFALMLDYSALDVWTGIIAFLILTTASVPAFQWVAKRDGDPWLSKVLLVGLLAKFAGSMARYYMIFVLYDGSGDAGRYHEAGAMFASRLRDGAPVHPLPMMEGFPLETQRIADFVGGLYTVSGPSAYVGFLVFTYICFWGQVLVARGFRVAVPEGDHRRFTLLVLFVPSLVFWPSSIGKEALMIGCLGLIAYGGALLLAPRPRMRGAGFFVAGSLLVLLVRPHVAAMAIGALAVAFAVGVLGGFQGIGPEARSRRGRAVRLAALVVVLALSAVASTRLARTFNEYDKGGGTLASLEGTASQTSRGGSEFVPMTITGPSRLPAGLVTVFFRPFPWEAGNVTGLLAGAEGLLLMIMFAVSWRRLLSLPRMALRRPFIVFALAYVLLFAVGFSFIANFGILARQRVQALPVLLIVLALPQARVPSLSFRRKDSDPESTEPGIHVHGAPPWASGDPVPLGGSRPARTPVQRHGTEGEPGPFDPPAAGGNPSRGSVVVAGRIPEMGGHESVLDR